MLSRLSPYFWVPFKSPLSFKMQLTLRVMFLRRLQRETTPSVSYSSVIRNIKDLRVLPCQQALSNQGNKSCIWQIFVDLTESTTTTYIFTRSYKNVHLIQRKNFSDSSLFDQKLTRAFATSSTVVTDVRFASNGHHMLLSNLPAENTAGSEIFRKGISNWKRYLTVGGKQENLRNELIKLRLLIAVFGQTCYS